jgi:hypothetical protein
VPTGCSVSKGRVAATSAVPFASMFPGLLYLKCGKVVIEPIHTAFPETAIVLHPIGNLAKRSSLQAAGTPLCVAATRDDTGTCEDLEMFGDGWRVIEKGSASSLTDVSPKARRARTAACVKCAMYHRANRRAKAVNLTSKHILTYKQ